MSPDPELIAAGHEIVEAWLDEWTSVDRAIANVNDGAKALDELKATINAVFREDLEEARRIARRLRQVIQTIMQQGPQWTTSDAIRAFDALPWAKGD